MSAAAASTATSSTPPSRVVGPSSGRVGHSTQPWTWASGRSVAMRSTASARLAASASPTSRPTGAHSSARRSPHTMACGTRTSSVAGRETNSRAAGRFVKTSRSSRPVGRSARGRVPAGPKALNSLRAAPTERRSAPAQRTRRTGQIRAAPDRAYRASHQPSQEPGPAVQTAAAPNRTARARRPLGIGGAVCSLERRVRATWPRTAIAPARASGIARARTGSGAAVASAAATKANPAQAHRAKAAAHTPNSVHSEGLEVARRRCSRACQGTATSAPGPGSGGASARRAAASGWTVQPRTLRWEGRAAARP